MSVDDERIALFLDYENLAIGAREALGRQDFDFRPIADALAERGRVVVRRAYADWSYFDDDRRMLTRHQVELIEIPQRMGVVRKNAADIKMAVDAIELSFERDYITTFVLGTGDSDFTPLVHKLRELNRRVIGVGVEASTSALLPPACDEFLFYERLEGVEPATSRRPAALVQPARPRRRRSRRRRTRSTESRTEATADEPDLGVLVTQTLAGLERTSDGPVLRVDAQAHDPAQGPDLQRGRLTASADSASCCATSPNSGVVESQRGQRPGRPRGALPDRTPPTRTRRSRCLRSTVEQLSARSAARRTSRA